MRTLRIEYPKAAGSWLDAAIKTLKQMGATDDVQSRAGGYDNILSVYRHTALGLAFGTYPVPNEAAMPSKMLIWVSNDDGNAIHMQPYTPDMSLPSDAVLLQLQNMTANEINPPLDGDCDYVGTILAITTNDLPAETTGPTQRSVSISTIEYQPREGLGCAAAIQFLKWAGAVDAERPGLLTVPVGSALDLALRAFSSNLEVGGDLPESIYVWPDPVYERVVVDHGNVTPPTTEAVRLKLLGAGQSSDAMIVFDEAPNDRKDGVEKVKFKDIHPGERFAFSVICHPIYGRPECYTKTGHCLAMKGAVTLNFQNDTEALVIAIDR